MKQTGSLYEIFSPSYSHFMIYTPLGLFFAPYDLQRALGTSGNQIFFEDQSEIFTLEVDEHPPGHQSQ